MEPGGARGVVVYQRGPHYLLELDMTMETELHCPFFVLFFALRSLSCSRMCRATEGWDLI